MDPSLVLIIVLTFAFAATRLELVLFGERTNLQDGTVVHVNNGGTPTVIGDNVLVGHNVMLHGCELQDDAFIGMNAVILDGCVIQENWTGASAEGRRAVEAVLEMI